MSLTEYVRVPIVRPYYTFFQFDGTQKSIDEFNEYLKQDRGWCEALFIDKDTWALKNAAFNNKFHIWPSGKGVMFEKTKGKGPIIVSNSEVEVPDSKYWSVKC